MSFQPLHDEPAAVAVAVETEAAIQTADDQDTWKSVKKSRCSSRRSRCCLISCITFCITFLPFLILSFIAYHDLHNLSTSMELHHMDIIVSHDMSIHTSITLHNIPGAVSWMPVTINDITCDIHMKWENITSPMAQATFAKGHAVHVISSQQKIQLDIHHINTTTASHTFYHLIIGNILKAHVTCHTNIQIQPFSLFSISTSYDIDADTNFSGDSLNMGKKEGMNETREWYEYIEFYPHVKTQDDISWAHQSLAFHFPWTLPSSDLLGNATILLHLPETSYGLTVYEPHYINVAIPSFTLDLSPSRQYDAFIPFTLSLDTKPDCMNDIDNVNMSTWRMLSCDVNLITDVIGSDHTIIWSVDESHGITSYGVAMDQYNNIIHGTGEITYQSTSTSTSTSPSSTSPSSTMRHPLAFIYPSTSPLTTINSNLTLYMNIGNHNLLVAGGGTVVVGGSRWISSVEGKLSIEWDSTSIINGNLSALIDAGSTPQLLTWTLWEWGGSNRIDIPRLASNGTGKILIADDQYDISVDNAYVYYNSITYTNISSHLQIHTIYKNIQIAIWEGAHVMPLSIPLQFDAFRPPVRQDVINTARLMGYVGGTYEFAHGLRVYLTSFAAFRGQFQSQAIASFDVDTSTQRITWDVKETPYNIAVSQITPYMCRIATTASATATSWTWSWSSIYHLSIDHISGVYMYKTYFNATAAIRIDTSSQPKTLSARIYEIPNIIIPIIPLLLDPVTLPSLSVSGTDGARFSMECLIALDTSNGAALQARVGVQLQGTPLSHSTLLASIDTLHKSVTLSYWENASGPATLTIVPSALRIYAGTDANWIAIFKYDHSIRSIEVMSNNMFIQWQSRNIFNASLHTMLDIDAQYIAGTMWESDINTQSYGILPLPTASTSVISLTDGARIYGMGYIGWDTSYGMSITSRAAAVYKGQLATNTTSIININTDTQVISAYLYDTNIPGDNAYPRFTTRMMGNYVKQTPYEIRMDMMEVILNGNTITNSSIHASLDDINKHVTASLWESNAIIPPYNTWSQNITARVYINTDVTVSYNDPWNIDGVVTIGRNQALLHSVAGSIHVDVIPNTLTWSIAESPYAIIPSPITWSSNTSTHSSWEPPYAYRLWSNGYVTLEHTDPIYGAYVKYAGVTWNGIIQANATGLAHVDIDKREIVITAWEAPISTLPNPWDLNVRVLSPYDGSRFSTATLLHGDVDDIIWGYVESTVILSSNIITNITGMMRIDTHQQTGMIKFSETNEIWNPFYFYQRIGGSISGRYQQIAYHVYDLSIDHVAGIWQKQTRFNATVHAQVDIDKPSMVIAIWEKPRTLDITIPLSLHIDAVNVTDGSRISAVFGASVDRSVGVTVTSQGVLAYNARVITNYTALVSYNNDIWSCSLIEATIPISSIPPYPTSYRLVVQGSGTSHFDTSLVDVSINTASIIYYGDIITNTTAHVRVDITAQTGGIAIWEGLTSSIPLPIPLPLDYQVSITDGNRFASQVYINVDTSIGVRMIERSGLALNGMMYTNSYATAWIDWQNHIITWLGIENNAPLAFPNNPTWDQRAYARGSSQGQFTWSTSNPYVITSNVDVTSRYRIITNATLSGGINTVLKVMSVSLDEYNAPYPSIPRLTITSHGIYDDFMTSPTDDGWGKQIHLDTILTKQGSIWYNTTINSNIHYNDLGLFFELLTHDAYVDKEIISLSWGATYTKTTPTSAVIPTFAPTSFPTLTPNTTAAPTSFPTFTPNTTVAPTSSPSSNPRIAAIIHLFLRVNATTFTQKYASTFESDLARVLGILTSRIYIINIISSNTVASSRLRYTTTSSRLKYHSMADTTATSSRLKYHIMADTESSITVITRIDPPIPGSSDTITAEAAANDLIQQVQTINSPLLTTTSFGSTIDTTKIPTVSYQTVSDSSTSSSSSSTPIGLTVGVVIGGVAAILLLLGSIWYIQSHRTRIKDTNIQMA